MMPKGHKSKNGYATVSESGGLGYREIAEKMTEEGDKMNHSTARNVFLSAMSKLAREICILQGMPTDQQSIKRLAADPRFQSGIMDIIKDADAKQIPEIYF
tara:strand:- start:1102 stop:1404 length:303 start_codon:yes stop_codon:yes gene_type:complete